MGSVTQSVGTVGNKVVGSAAGAAVLGMYAIKSKNDNYGEKLEYNNVYSANMSSNNYYSYSSNTDTYKSESYGTTLNA